MDHTPTHTATQTATEQVDYGLRHAQRTAYVLGAITAWTGFAEDGHVTPDEALVEIRLLLDDYTTARLADDKSAEADR